MIVGGRLPRGGGVTNPAIMVELIADVVRQGGIHVIRLMAGPAVGGRSGELTIDMALGASHIHVRPGQRERCLAVVEG